MNPKLFPEKLATMISRYLRMLLLVSYHLKIVNLSFANPPPLLGQPTCFTTLHQTKDNFLRIEIVGTNTSESSNQEMIHESNDALEKGLEIFMNSITQKKRKCAMPHQCSHFAEEFGNSFSW
jgi:hypothetical protein